jgi:transcriptional regulator with XRE-family HTH domain
MTLTATPDPIDIHVGVRIRLLRKQQNISQTQLAHSLGITFQQVQKYENGANRVSCSMLYKAAQFLKAPPGYFFDGLGDQPVPGEASRVDILASAAAARIPAIRRIAELSNKECAAVSGIIGAFLAKEAA